ncbi:MAG: alpha/beta fold hydrolase [Bifidobacteriaceae bacterium]|nr:alpha/beta fold hydrolase [Bifidobacteriaceae bacterium]
MTRATASSTETIGAQTILPAERRPFQVTASDGVRLVGEVALPPEGRGAKATLVLLHPLPTEGGSMDSHVFRKAAWRLPALADLAVIRFNTRGTCSGLGCSDGEFDGGVAEGRDVAAVVAYGLGLGLPKPWLVGWSFGSELALMHGARLPVEGVIALSPPLRRARSEHLIQWAAARKPVTALVPEKDQFLSPAEARARFAMVPAAKVVEAKDAVHLWIGEKAVRQVLDAIVEVARPGFGPLPTTWDGPSEIYGRGRDGLVSPGNQSHQGT